MKQENNTILPYDQSNFLWRVSFFSLFSAGYALYKGHYDLALIPGGVFLTSINYWRRPDYSWRRYIDMLYVTAGLLYQIYRAKTLPQKYVYYSSLVLSIGFYPMGVYLYNKKLYWLSTYAHSMIHITANLSNIFLYNKLH